MSSGITHTATVEAQQPTEPVLEVLGTWLGAVRLDDVPASVVATAKRGLLDLLGVTLAAAGTPLAEVVGRYLDHDGAGGATVIGLGRRANAPVAALANGALGHALDFDDVSHSLGGHPSVPVVPAALAVAEVSGASGADLLLGYVAGVEIETQIARAVNFAHYDKGWHPTATLGGFGAAAAAARAFGLDGEGCVTALSLATAFAAGLKSGFGTMAKPIQVGRAAQGGVTAALLSRAGATANTAAFEAKQGFASVFNGAGTYDLPAATGRLANPWDLDDPGLALKRHPCCGGTHAAVDAALALRQELGGADDVRAVMVSIHPARFAHLDRPVLGDDPLEAKFSLQYAVGLALRHGRVAMSHFTEEALADPRLRELVAATSATALAPERCGPERFAAEVTLTLADGSDHHLRLERPVGRTPDTALSDADVEDKFRGCADGLLSVAEQDELAALVWSIEDQPGVTRLASLLSAADRAGAGR